MKTIRSNLFTRRWLAWPGRVLRSAWGLAAWCALLAAGAYGGALALPFFFDDFVQLPYADAHTIGEMWRSAGSLAYYRPLSFTFWKLARLALGHHSPLLHHSLNVALHAGNAFLVGWLAARLWTGERARPDWLRAYMAAALFAWFPFSYQAVPWVSAVHHLLMVNLVLLALAAYLKSNEGGRRWAALGLVATALAPFSHENGALVGPLVGLLELTRPGRRRAWRPLLARVALWSLPAALWLPVWWAAPKAIDARLAVQSPEAIMQNSAYFLQGLGYALAWPGGALVRGGVNDMVAVLLLAGAGLAAVAAVQWRAGAGRRAWLPWLWYAVAALPVLLVLPFDYVINGPRLLMLGSAGAAWLWSDVALLARPRRSPKTSEVLRPRGQWRPALAAALLLSALLSGFAVIHSRMELHRFLGQTYAQATAAAVVANESGRRAALVNLPSWLAPARATYALGHEGVLFWPDYAPEDALVGVGAGRPGQVALLQHEAIRPAMPYYYGLVGDGVTWAALAARPSRVLLTRYMADSATVVTAGELPIAPSPAAWLARFTGPGGGTVWLLESQTTAQGAAVQSLLVWRVDGRLPDDLTVFVHALGQDGALAAQADGDPLGGTLPLPAWPAGSAALDVRRVAAAGPVTALLVGLYRRSNGERLMAVGADGRPLADNALRLPVDWTASSAIIPWFNPQ